MFKQSISAKRGTVGKAKSGKLDGFKRMLNRSGGHCTVAEECAAEKEAVVFQTSLAQMERDRATALQQLMRMDTVR